eukprot:354023-Chlamydomonas_euryale.AAC.4
MAWPGHRRHGPALWGCAHSCCPERVAHACKVPCMKQLLGHAPHDRVTAGSMPEGAGRILTPILTPFSHPLTPILNAMLGPTSRRAAEALGWRRNLTVRQL